MLFSVVVLLAGNGTSYAQQSGIDAVKAAIAAYHAALGPLSGANMDPLWAHDANVMLINPRDKSISVGWDAVKKNWESASNLWSELKVTQVDGSYSVARLERWIRMQDRSRSKVRRLPRPSAKEDRLLV